MCIYSTAPSSSPGKLHDSISGARKVSPPLNTGAARALDTVNTEQCPCQSFVPAQRAPLGIALAQNKGVRSRCPFGTEQTIKAFDGRGHRDPRRSKRAWGRVRMTDHTHIRPVTLASLLAVSLLLASCGIEPNPSPWGDDFAESPVVPVDPGASSGLGDGGLGDEGEPADLGTAGGGSGGQTGAPPPTSEQIGTCENLQCGPGADGNVCGWCAGQDSCQEGRCVASPDCTPDCDEQAFGSDDGCGGVCSSSGIEQALAPGGAQNVTTFREAILAGDVPSPDLIPLEGWLNEHRTALPAAKPARLVTVHGLVGLYADTVDSEPLIFLQLGLQSDEPKSASNLQIQLKLSPGFVLESAYGFDHILNGEEIQLLGPSVQYTLKEGDPPAESPPSETGAGRSETASPSDAETFPLVLLRVKATDDLAWSHYDELTIATLSYSYQHADNGKSEVFHSELTLDMLSTTVPGTLESLPTAILQRSACILRAGVALQNAVSWHSSEAAGTGFASVEELTRAANLCGSLGEMETDPPIAKDITLLEMLSNTLCTDGCTSVSD